MSFIDVISDNSNKNLTEVPPRILEMYNLKMLYLEGNCIEYLPDDMFEKLGKLTWLDLRRNKLKSIPIGIAYHTFLETLLLQDNEIETLPVEIGLVPSLKVLQLSGNPLKYPVSNIIEEGTESVLEHLKQEYYKLNPEPTDEEDKEEETEIITYNYKDAPEVHQKHRRMTIQDLLRQTVKKYSIHNANVPIIQVTSLSKMTTEEGYNVKVKSIVPIKTTYKVARSCSRLSLRSQNQWNSKRRIPVGKFFDQDSLQDLWLNKLKDLLANQEKILQQERNLRALSKWRTEKRMEPPRASLDEIPEAPFATDSNEKMLTRQELSNQIDQMIKKNKRATKKYSSRKTNVQKLINDVVDQMKNMELKINSSMPPATEKNIATQQIESIIELHKKIIALQQLNDQT